jgi:hypothetical protein
LDGSIGESESNDYRDARQGCGGKLDAVFTGSTTNYNLSTTELSGAQIVSGLGGNGGTGAGGVGGNVSQLNVAVEGFIQNRYTSNPDPHDLTPYDGTTIWIAGGNLTVTTGAGGTVGTGGTSCDAFAKYYVSG